MSDGVSRFEPGSPEPKSVEYPAAPTPGLYLPPEVAESPAPGRSKSKRSRSGAKAPAAPRAPRSRSTTSRRRASRARTGFASIVVVAIALATMTAVFALMGRYAFLAWLTGIPALVVSVKAVAQRAQPRRSAIAALMCTVIAAPLSIAMFSQSIGDDSPSTDARPQSSPTPAIQHVYGTLGAHGEIRDGLWRVGEDIEPGLYRVSDEVDPNAQYWDCTWFTYASADHSEENEIDSMWGAAGLPVVDLTGVAEFETADCGNWELVDPGTLFDNPDALAMVRPGMWLVGEDVAPGTYRPSTPIVLEESFSMCFWVAFEGASSSDRAVVTSGIADGGLPTVSLSEAHTFYSRGCGTWVPADPTQFFQRADAPTQFPQGVWLVGEDIAPGTYSTVVPFVPEDDYSYCSWSIAATWDTGQYQSLESNSSQDEGTRTVTLTTGQRFDSTGCGDWILTGP